MDKILIIEDQIDIAELQQDYLTINGYDVTIETDGKKGWDLALKEDFDLVILDVMLGEVSGFQICKDIRSQKEIPIIMVTARSEDIDKIRGLGLGADDYMTKPFSPQELIARVKAHIGRYKRLINTSDEKNIIKLSSLTLEADSRRVYKFDEELVLTTREFDLLHFLMTNPNIVFSKEALFEKLWGFDGYGDIRTVAVHIKRVREKIEINPSDPKIIETVWGAGYRFNKI
ncbi:response regulator transcription factor [Acidaminobacter sp. JC074]|uniref:response regulator transcription factor n=1 Tax=Acidaminobacter sp. JC074 TaxID=2530199 RepID=UPI001F108D50|nr:response regulator transcription factor [Acidaminobacter sp. JC074]MCH4889137.1 response regulator transcription factor [Acidaminobacter sp. JC074]